MTYQKPSIKSDKKVLLYADKWINGNARTKLWCRRSSLTFQINWDLASLEAPMFLNRFQGSGLKLGTAEQRGENRKGLWEAESSTTSRDQLQSQRTDLKCLSHRQLLAKFKIFCTVLVSEVHRVSTSSKKFWSCTASAWYDIWRKQKLVKIEQQNRT